MNGCIVSLNTKAPTSTIDSVFGTYSNLLTNELWEHLLLFINKLCTEFVNM